MLPTTLNTEQTSAEIDVLTYSFLSDENPMVTNNSYYDLSKTPNDYFHLVPPPHLSEAQDYPKPDYLLSADTASDEFRLTSTFPRTCSQVNLKNSPISLRTDRLRRSPWIAELLRRKQLNDDLNNASFIVTAEYPEE